ncbi:unnamed protein product [Prorocentrum cordatum]|uniref:Uncharacterized protein n=1 Tax=Prorocentrum cordatum TaxID=2364126 RepID=A0ABN9S4N9_9DINO|nr:unnamed protein product [Polarella glacialis]
MGQPAVQAQYQAAQAWGGSTRRPRPEEGLMEARRRWAPSSLPGFGPYFDDLRTHWTPAARSRFPLFWPRELRRELQGTLALDVFTVGEQGVAREYELLGRLCPEMVARRSLEEYRSAWCLVNSRVLTYPGDPEAPPGPGGGREAQSALMPLFDMVNHALPVPPRRLNTTSQVQEHHRQTVGRYGVRDASIPGQISSGVRFDQNFEAT